jgi:hypothetical protein
MLPEVWNQVKLYSDGKHVPGHEPEGFEHLSEEQSAHIGNGATQTQEDA